jgi:hypothetical protein
MQCINDAFPHQAIDESMPEITLTEAAQWAGKDRTTIFKAIKQGGLSARKTDKGQWMIDPAELERVYPPSKTVNVDVDMAHQYHAIDRTTAALRQVIATLEGQVNDLKAQREDWKAERDRLLGMIESQTRVLTDQRRWWQRFRKA